MSQSSVIPSGWLPLSEAVQKLGRSPKTVERLVANGELTSRLIPMEGRKPQRVYSADSIDAMRGRLGKRAERAPLRNPEPRALSPQRAEMALSADAVAKLDDVVTRWLNRPSPPVPLTEKLWLSLEEAAALSGLSAGFIRDSIVEPAHYKESENLIGVRGGPRGAWRIQRASLEAFAG